MFYKLSNGRKYTVRTYFWVAEYNLAALKTNYQGEYHMWLVL